jgi:hypothetical protein
MAGFQSPFAVADTASAANSHLASPGVRAGAPPSPLAELLNSWQQAAEQQQAARSPGPGGAGLVGAAFADGAAGPCDAAPAPAFTPGAQPAAAPRQDARGEGKPQRAMPKDSRERRRELVGAPGWQLVSSSASGASMGMRAGHGAMPARSHAGTEGGAAFPRPRTPAAHRHRALLRALQERELEAQVTALRAMLGQLQREHTALDLRQQVGVGLALQHAPLLAARLVPPTRGGGRVHAPATVLCSQPGA